jgi:cytochrome c6
MSTCGRALYAVIICWSAALAIAATSSEAAPDKKSEALFKEHCAACHPDGGNIINPKKTLKKADLQANKVTSADDIVRVMRNPGPGMLKFDAKTIPDKEAKELAEYILKKYGK